MPPVSIRDLANRASAVVRDVTESGRPAIVTRSGTPVAAVIPIEADALEDWVLANAPELVASMGEADDDLRAGRTLSHYDVWEHLGVG